MEQQFCGRSAEGSCFNSLFIPQVHATIRTECNLTYDFIRMQKIREDGENLYFNAKSSWRWCEFSAHPRVMLYADRTGAEFSDMRVREELLGALVVNFPLLTASN